MTKTLPAIIAALVALSLAACGGELSDDEMRWIGDYAGRTESQHFAGCEPNAPFAWEFGESEAHIVERDGSLVIVSAGFCDLPLALTEGPWARIPDMDCGVFRYREGVAHLGPDGALTFGVVQYAGSGGDCTRSIRSFVSE